MNWPAEIKDLVLKGVSQEELLEKFRVQLEKDLHMSNTSFHVGELNDLRLQELTLQLSEALQKMPSGLFQELLYRVDISESQIRKKTQDERDKDLNTIIAELIIKRILQKVVFKLVYSKNNDHKEGD